MAGYPRPPTLDDVDVDKEVIDSIETEKEEEDVELP
jgi:hypothetical protein